MKIASVVKLIGCGKFADSKEWSAARRRLHAAIRKVEWPKGSGNFTIHAQSGKKRGEGNGVKPIKDGLMLDLAKIGYDLQAPAVLSDRKRFGKFDALLTSSCGPIVVEWETGNISSSHRSLNKMSLFLMEGKIAGGILIVPSRRMYRYLTDRVGNIQELEPYFGLWQKIPCKQGVLEIVVIEQDAESTDVPRIKKGTDGRALA